MQLPESEKLNIGYLSHLFDNKSECYKLFWFEAILTKVTEGMSELTYNELINEMIVSAWYMVAEYKLNLGPADTLEALVHLAYNDGENGILSSAKKEDILCFLENTEDKGIQSKKRTLSLNVPYRLQSPFIETFHGKEWNVSVGKLSEKINQEKHLMYYFILIAGLDSKIRIQPEWFDYMTENQGILKGWIEYNKIIYLQRRNPSVPGIAAKLYPEQKRNLKQVQEYWERVMSVIRIPDIYVPGTQLDKNISIDHFVPWSYVAHDEFWNLVPTSKSANSSKSNQLPEWNIYFPELGETEYEAYQMVWKYDKIHDSFEKCLDYNLNSTEVKQHLYRKGLAKDEFIGELQNILEPVYQSAKQMGFKVWENNKGRDTIKSF